MNNRSLAISIGFLLAAQSLHSAAAPVPVPEDTVATRVRPELAPTGVPLGSFTLMPQVGVDTSRRTNIYSQGENPIDDTVTVFNPKLEVRSNWSRHSLAVSAEVEAGRFADNPTENYDDVRFAANGRVVVSRNSSMRFSARLASLHEDRFSQDNRNGATPTLYDQSTYLVGYDHERGRLSLKLEASLTTTDVDDVQGVDRVIENDDRDRERSEFVLAAGYSVRPGFEVVAAGKLTSIDYATPPAGIDLRRDSSGGEFTVGAQLDLTNRSSLDGFVGYASRDYDDPELEDIDTGIFGATFTFRVSGLTTLTANATRSISETALAGSGGLVATQYGVGVDHELLRNFLLHGSVFRRETNFTSTDRRDADRVTRFAASYLMNRRWNVELEYQSRTRNFSSVDVPQIDLDTGELTLSIKSMR